MQRVCVTGGSSGIGLAIATLFASSGYRVDLLGTNSEKGQRAVESIGARYPTALVHFHALDVSKTALVDAFFSTLDFVDILINCAGITQDQLLLRMKEEDWDRVLQVNAKSCFNTCRAVMRSMMKARKGKIINVSSVVGITGNPGQTNYAASKGAVISFTKALALEVASRGIQVNAIAPGFIETAMTDGLTEEQKASILSKIPLGRMGRPEEVAQLALFLAGADYITGQVFVIDGGMVT